MAAFWKVKAWTINGQLVHENVQTKYFQKDQIISVTHPKDIVCADGIGLDSYRASGTFGMDGVSESISLRMASYEFPASLYTSLTSAGETVIYDGSFYWPRIYFSAEKYDYTNPSIPDAPVLAVAGYTPSGPPSDPPQPGPDQIVNYFLEAGPLDFAGLSIRLCRPAYKSTDSGGTVSNFAFGSWSGSISPSEYWSFA